MVSSSGSGSRARARERASTNWSGRGVRGTATEWDDLGPSPLVSRPLPAFSDPLYSEMVTVESPLDQVLAEPLLQAEDRRLFVPLRGDTRRPTARRISGAPARLSAPALTRPQVRSALPVFLPPVVTFKRSSGVVVCVRRHRRRQVILAYGRGGGRHRPPRRGPDSGIACR